MFLTMAKNFTRGNSILLYLSRMRTKKVKLKKSSKIRQNNTKNLQKCPKRGCRM